MVKRNRVVEPVIENWDTLTENEKKEALVSIPRWYQENIESKILREYFFEFAETNVSPKDFQDLKSGVPWITDLDGAVARIVLRGYVTPRYTSYLLENRIPKVISYVRDSAQKKEQVAELLGKNLPSKTKEAYKPTIQERIAEQSGILLGVIDGEIDSFLSNKCKKSKFSMLDYLRKSDVKGPHTKHILKYLASYLKELKTLLAGKDLQLVEGYSFLTKPQQKKYFDFINEMNNDALEWQQRLKKTRKPRKKKIKSAEQQTSSLNFLDEDAELKIKSIDPKNIIGATQLWVYNTKDRFLYMYNSNHGMTVKGSTVYEWDPDLSFKKKLRKPEIIIPDVLSGGKVKLRKIMPSIRAKEGKVTGRINDKMIILRAIK